MTIDKKFLYRVLPNWTDTFYYSAFSCIFPSPFWTCSWKWLQFGSMQSLSHVQLFETPWTAARQAFLSFTISRSLRKLKSTESVMPSNQLVLCHPLVLHCLPEFVQPHVHWVSDAIQPSNPSVIPFSSCLQSFPASGFFSIESALHIRWQKYWSFSVSPS